MSKADEMKMNGTYGQVWAFSNIRDMSRAQHLCNKDPPGQIGGVCPCVGQPFPFWRLPCCFFIAAVLTFI